MARNVEKAQNVLNRLLAKRQQDAGQSGPRARRPFRASDCDDLADADRWRASILREIGAKVMDIQNAGLGEGRLRDLNDEINKLIREKGHWERRIKELGGPDYAKSAPPVGGDEGGGRKGGYKYFGAARNLPGVKELLEPPPAKPRKATRAAMVARINADYYGFRDEDGGGLVAAEAAAEPARAARLAAEWRAKAEAGGDALAAALAAGAGDSAPAAAAAGADDEEMGDAAPTLPDAAAIEARVVARKKAELLARYASPALAAEQARAAELLHRK